MLENLIQERMKLKIAAQGPAFGRRPAAVIWVRRERKSDREQFVVRTEDVA